jgi:glutathione synthase/RimK-type ligase-like ATP-grasp enzyme
LAADVRAIVLVPAPDYGEAWDWAYDVEAAVLERGGIAVEARPWTEAGDIDEADLVLPLVAWGYHDDPQRWHALIDRLESEGAHVLNPVPVLRWNSDKVYLEELGAKGVPTIQSHLVEAMDEAALAEARAKWGDDIVIKPPVSASATGTHRLHPNDPLPADAVGKPIIVQPFLRSVTDEGEYSLMLFDGVFSHAVVKRPKAGDYRVQPHLGGREEPCQAPDGAIEIAKAALAAAPGDPAYARVDLVRGNDGALKIMELELIEPSLWLQHAPDKGESFAAAIRRRANP